MQPWALHATPSPYDASFCLDHAKADIQDTRERKQKLEKAKELVMEVESEDEAEKEAQQTAELQHAKQLADQKLFMVQENLRKKGGVEKEKKPEGKKKNLSKAQLLERRVNRYGSLLKTIDIDIEEEIRQQREKERLLAQADNDVLRRQHEAPLHRHGEQGPTWCMQTLLLTWSLA